MTLVPGRNGEGDRANAVLTAKRGKRGVVELVVGKSREGQDLHEVVSGWRSGSWQQVLGKHLPSPAITVTVCAAVPASQEPHRARETKHLSLLPVPTISSSSSET